MRRVLTAALCAALLWPAPVVADSGLTQAVGVATLARTPDATLHQHAHQRAVQIVGQFEHCCFLPGTGEVIGWNRGHTDPIAAVVQGWLASPTHYTILMDPAYTRVGCAEHVADDPREPGADNTHFFVCIVGTGAPPQVSEPPAPTPAPKRNAPGVVLLPDTALGG